VKVKPLKMRLMKILTLILILAPAPSGIAYAQRVGCTSAEAIESTNLTVTFARLRDTGVSENEATLSIMATLKGNDLIHAVVLMRIAYRHADDPGDEIGRLVLQECADAKSRPPRS
jgi:hypothetical protein